MRSLLTSGFYRSRVRVSLQAALILLAASLGNTPLLAQQAKAHNSATAPLRLNAKEYFEAPGVNVMAFQDIYPDGHQGGVSVIENGDRIATNGDLRLDPTPGQWNAMPAQKSRVVDRATGTISTRLAYPDPTKNRTGFNPIEYPDLNFSYVVHVRAEGNAVHVSVDLDQPIPEQFVDRVGFNLELYPNDYFGKTWYLGGASGIFPRQGNGPEFRDAAGELQAKPLAAGAKLSVAPETDDRRLTIESRTGDLQLIDGRNKFNNGWFTVRSHIAHGRTKNVVEWIITPHGEPGWSYGPVVHVSQVGYHPGQTKVAILELDKATAAKASATLLRIDESGGTKEVLRAIPKPWGDFLRYKYARFDFSSVHDAGMYEVRYAGVTSQPFRIAPDVYGRGVWQPVLEYFLPVQMCHMRVEQQYRVWHGACHLDDARMAPTSYNHFDGYSQGASTLTKWKSGETVPELNQGGWHDAGDFDLRIESQADEVSILAAAYEAFHLDYDDTSVDEKTHLTEIHVPDGKADALQQVEHGVLSILGGYRSMGRLYRGIQEATLPQYTMLGDQSNATDGLFYNADLKSGERTATESSKPDDRLVFTEENPDHEYRGIAALAAAGRVLKTVNPTLANECTEAALKLWDGEKDPRTAFDTRVRAEVELWRTTHNERFRKDLLGRSAEILKDVAKTGWVVAPIAHDLNDAAFTQALHDAVAADFKKMAAQQNTDSPFGIPYKPYIWGAGWEVERFGVEQYYLHRAFPDVVSAEYMLNALNFMLGVHPGSNTASFASGVGARSTTIAYGFNRADSSYIPGGVVSGTALIRPDFPELKDFGYLWQQMEYVLGGGSSNYMFLVLAADQVLNESSPGAQK